VACIILKLLSGDVKLQSHVVNKLWDFHESALVG
jgi:hypothetical protein